MFQFNSASFYIYDIRATCMVTNRHSCRVTFVRITYDVLCIAIERNLKVWKINEA